MTQIGHAITHTNRKYDSYESLKKNLGANLYKNVKEYERQVTQTTADAAANIEEVNSNTLTAMSASKALQVWEKTGHTAGNIDLAGTVEWQTLSGVVTAATFTTHHTDTTTHVALVAAVTTARHIRSFELTAADISTHDLLLGNVAGDEIFAVIKTGYHQCLKSKFMGGLGRRSFIGKITLELSVVTAVVTMVCTFTPVGATVSTTKTFISNSVSKTWEPCLEIAAGSEVSWTIEDDNAAHPVATFGITYVEAY
jgi:hypothetical protein